MTISGFSLRLELLLQEVGSTNKERENGLRSMLDAVHSPQLDHETVAAALEGIKKSFSPEFRSGQPHLVADFTRVVDDEIMRIREKLKKRLREEEQTETLRRQRLHAADHPTTELEKVSEKPEEQSVSSRSVLDQFSLKMIHEDISRAERRNFIKALRLQTSTGAFSRGVQLVIFEYCRNLSSDPELQELVLAVFDKPLHPVPEQSMLLEMDNQKLDEHFRPFVEFARLLENEWNFVRFMIQDPFFDGPVNFQTIIENPSICKETLRDIRSFYLMLIANNAFVNGGGHLNRVIFGTGVTGLNMVFYGSRGVRLVVAEMIAKYVRSNREKIVALDPNHLALLRRMR